MSATQRVHYRAESRVDSTEPANEEKGTIRLTNRDKTENKLTKRTLEKREEKDVLLSPLPVCLIHLYCRLKMS
jgi:hypothetical protein